MQKLHSQLEVAGVLSALQKHFKVVGLSFPLQVELELCLESIIEAFIESGLGPFSHALGFPDKALSNFVVAGFDLLVSGIPVLTV
jgi:hypothetical protein